MGYLLITPKSAQQKWEPGKVNISKIANLIDPYFYPHQNTQNILTVYTEKKNEVIFWELRKPVAGLSAEKCVPFLFIISFLAAQ